MVESKSMTAQEIVCQDLAELYIGNLNTVDADLKLPVCGRNGSRFTWESRQILFISHEGKVTRPTHGVGNRKVILDVTAIAIVIGERTFIPLADIDQQKYHVYLKR